MNDKKNWVYNGPVFWNGDCVCRDWTARTSAVSKAKALSNLKYRYKNAYGYIYNAVIELPGTIREDRYYG